MERLVDLDELVIRCRAEQSKSHLSEAVACYRAGAYRACIVSTWIAIVYDLIDKFRELAISGQGSAKDLITDFEKWQEQIRKGDPQAVTKALTFERGILDVARDKFEMLDQLQHEDLCRLRDDRHRCAHPSFHTMEQPFAPSAEIARAHLRNAALHLLQYPPVQGKAALARLRREISSNYFPTDATKARAQLIEGPLNRASEPLVRNFVDLLVFGFFEEQGPLSTSARTVAALRATFQMYPAIVETRLRQQLNKVSEAIADESRKHIFCFLEHYPEALDFLPDHEVEKLRNFVATAPTSDFLFSIEGCNKLPTFQPEMKARIKQLDADDLIGAIFFYGLGALAIDRGIELLGEARSWDQANEIFKHIIFPLFENLDSDHISTILSLPEQGADLKGSYGLSQFIQQVREVKMPSDKLDKLLHEKDMGFYAESDPDDDDDEGIPF